MRAEESFTIGPGLYHNNSAVFSPCGRYLTYFHIDDENDLGHIHCLSPKGDKLRSWQVDVKAYLMTSVGVSPSSSHVVVGFASCEQHNNAGQVKIYEWSEGRVAASQQEDRCV